MKRIFVCLLGVMILAGCLCGCSDGAVRNDFVTATPSVTIAPDMLPVPDNGNVNDTDGIIEKPEDNTSRREDNAAASASPKVSASPAPTDTATPTASQSPAPKT